MSVDNSVLGTVALVVVGILIYTFIFVVPRPPSKAYQIQMTPTTSAMDRALATMSTPWVDRRSDDQKAADKAHLSDGLVGYAPGTRGAAGWS